MGALVVDPPARVIRVRTIILLRKPLVAVLKLQYGRSVGQIPGSHHSGNLARVDRCSFSAFPTTGSGRGTLGLSRAPAPRMGWCDRTGTAQPRPFRGGTARRRSRGPGIVIVDSCRAGRDFWVMSRIARGPRCRPGVPASRAGWPWLGHCAVSRSLTRTAAPSKRPALRSCSACCARDIGYTWVVARTW
jgi:hypothetical protein